MGLSDEVEAEISRLRAQLLEKERLHELVACQLEAEKVEREKAQRKVWGGYMSGGYMEGRYIWGGYMWGVQLFVQVNTCVFMCIIVPLYCV